MTMSSAMVKAMGVSSGLRRVDGSTRGGGGKKAAREDGEEKSRSTMAKVKVK
jgi:hypothetical protein